MKRAILITFSDIINDFNCRELNPGCEYKIVYNSEFDTWVGEVIYPENEEDE